MAKIDWNIIEENIAKGEMTRKSAFDSLMQITRLNISHYEDLLVASRENPGVYTNPESYRKSLSECYQALADLRKGVRVTEIPF